MIDQTIVGVYLFCVLLLGLWAGRGVKNIEQYSVVNRSYSSWIIFATLSASFIGGGFSIGNAEKVNLFGIVYIFALFGFSLKEILVAKFIAPQIGKFPNAISVGDIMETNYGKVGKVVTGVFSVAVCSGIVGAQVGGIGYIFNVFLGIPVFWGITIGCGIVILYSTIGGMQAVVWTDVMQFIVLAFGIPLTLFMGIQYAGGIDAIQQAVPATHFSLVSEKMTLLAFISLFLTFVLGETLVPPYVQRLFIGKDSIQVARGTLLSGIFSIPFFAIAGCIGLVALTLAPDIDPNKSLPYVVNTVLPIGLKGLVIAGIVSIVMSSADSFLNSASVAFTHDIVQPLRQERLSEKHELLLAKVVTCFAGVAAIVFAVKIKSILGILIYTYNFWSPIILVPLVAVILGVKASSRDFVAGSVAGIAGVLVWNMLLDQPGGVDGLIIGIFCNLVAFYIMRKLGKGA